MEKPLKHPSPQHTSVYSLSMSNLMNRDEHIWDFTKIEDFFPTKVSRVIVDTPLSESISVDQSCVLMRTMDCIRLSRIPVCYQKKIPHKLTPCSRGLETTLES